MKARVEGYAPDSRLAGRGGYINGGFMVMEPEIFNWVEPFNECVLEREVFDRLAHAGQAAVFPHEGYWQSLDTERDLLQLNALYEDNRRPWLPAPSALGLELGLEPKETPSPLDQENP